MMEWFGEFMGMITSIFPRYFVVDPDENGVLVRCGKIRTEKGKKGILGPGLYWMWPIIDDSDLDKISIQVMDLPDIVSSTEEGIPVTVSGSIEYHVDNLISSLYNVANYRDNVLNVGTATVCDAISKTSWEKPVSEIMGELEEMVEKNLNEKSSEWGVKIDSVYVNKFAKTKVIDLTHHNSQGAYADPYGLAE